MLVKHYISSRKVTGGLTEASFCCVVAAEAGGSCPTLPTPHRGRSERISVLKPRRLHTAVAGLGSGGAGTCSAAQGSF